MDLSDTVVLCTKRQRSFFFQSLLRFHFQKIITLVPHTCLYAVFCQLNPEPCDTLFIYLRVQFRVNHQRRAGTTLTEFNSTVRPHATKRAPKVNKNIRNALATMADTCRSVKWRCFCVLTAPNTASFLLPKSQPTAHANKPRSAAGTIQPGFTHYLFTHILLILIGEYEKLS